MNATHCKVQDSAKKAKTGKLKQALFCFSWLNVHKTESINPKGEINKVPEAN